MCEAKGSEAFETLQKMAVFLISSCTKSYVDNQILHSLDRREKIQNIAFVIWFAGLMKDFACLSFVKK